MWLAIKCVIRLSQTSNRPLRFFRSVPEIALFDNASMAKTLSEYLEWLESRKLMWPAPPKREPVKATPFVKPFENIGAVVWNIYGTLLRIADGRLLYQHEKEFRMQVALEKTIEEFNMWNSMFRTQEAPWQYMLGRYQKHAEELEMLGTVNAGDVPEVNMARIWLEILEELSQKEYSYDQNLYGDDDEWAEKVAYFFHACLQGVEASPNALTTLRAVTRSDIEQGLLSDAQPFSLAELMKELTVQDKDRKPPVAAKPTSGILRKSGKKGAPVSQSKFISLADLFSPAFLTLSHLEGVRKPSRSLYENCIQRFRKAGIPPAEILLIGTDLENDLAIASELGMKTALYTGDKLSLNATQKTLNAPETRPDRLITDLLQIKSLLDIE